MNAAVAVLRRTRAEPWPRSSGLPGLARGSTAPAFKGTLYQRTDRRDAAQGELVIAAEMYRAMEMTFWLTRAETALAMV